MSNIERFTTEKDDADKGAGSRFDIFDDKKSEEDMLSRSREVVVFGSPQEQVLKENGIEKTSDLGGGVNVVKFIKIKDDGTAIFKPALGEMGGTPELGQGYKRERAVYLVDMFVGFNLVPPTIIRSTKEYGEGSLQQFIENARAGSSLASKGLGEDSDFMKQAGNMMLLDLLIANTDRHSGNYLVEDSGKLHAIDNAGSFSREPFFGKQCEQGFKLDKTNFEFNKEVVDKIKALAEDQGKRDILNNLLRELLPKKVVELFFKRLDLLAKYIIDNRISLEDNEKMEQGLVDFNQVYDDQIEDKIEIARERGVELSELIEELVAIGEMDNLPLDLAGFKGLNKESAQLLIDTKYPYILIHNLDKFEGLDQEIALQLIERGYSQRLVQNIDRFKNLNYKKFAKELIKKECGRALGESLHQFPGLDYEEVVRDLIKYRQGYVIVENIDKFTGLSHEAIVEELIDKGYGSAIVHDIDKFKGLDYVKVAKQLISCGHASSLAWNLNNFNGLDKDIASELIKRDYAGQVATNLDSFNNLDQENAEQLIERGYGKAVVLHIKVFKGLDDAILEEIKKYQ